MVRGGAVQRLKAGRGRRGGRGTKGGGVSSANPQLDPAKTELGNRLVDLCAWKHISPQLVQELALKSLQDVIHVIRSLQPDCDDLEGVAASLLPGLVKLANLGTKGRHKNNINAQLLAALPPAQIPINYFKVPLKIPGHALPQPCEQAALWPHHVFAALYHKSKTAFHLRVCPGGDRLESFWKSQEGHPNFARLAHLLRDRPNWRRKAVPIKLHGDGAPVVGVGKSWGKSQDFVSWGSMVVQYLFIMFQCVYVCEGGG